jgi:transglutaminase-like putative cysteine protease
MMAGTASSDRSVAFDASLLFVASLIGLAGFGTVYSGQSYLAVGAAGLGLGMATAYLAYRLRWPIIAVAGVAVAVLTLAAGPIALWRTTSGGVLPTASTLSGLAEGAVGGWRELLTTLPPVPGAGALLVPPYLCGFVAGLVGLLFAARTRVVVLPVLPAAAVLGASILLGTREPAALLPQSCGFALVVLVWATARQRRLRPVELAGRSRGTRLTGAAAMLAVAVGITGGVAFLPLHAPDRYVLREHIEPPFDPNAYPSPLAGFRWYEVKHKGTVLFSATGVPAGARIRLAVMDAYDGVVWSVAGGPGSTEASGVFERVGARIPGPPPGPVATITITVAGLEGVWLPTVGSATQVRFTGPRADDLTSSFRYNRSTGVGVVPLRLHKGDGYALEAVVPPTPSVESVGTTPAGEVTLPDIATSAVPDQVRQATVDWLGSAGTPAARLGALVTRLRGGAFSDGTGPQGYRSRPGHGEARLAEFLAASQLVGDSEQYAATLALLARQLGLPARVVVGVVPPAGWTGGEVTGGMVSAWVEVDFAGVGWVPFDPTPPVTNTPKPEQPQVDPNGTAELVAPPVTEAQPPTALPPPDRDRTSADDSAPVPSPWWWAIIAALVRYAGPPVAVVALALGTVVGLKWRRRRRRRRGDARQQVAGGWRELLDGLRDLGVVLPRTRTRRLAALALDDVDPALLPVDSRQWTFRLAESADLLIFGPDPATAEQVSVYWREVRDCVRATAAGRTRWRRFLAVVNPASLGLAMPSRLPARLGQLTWISSRLEARS